MSFCQCGLWRVRNTQCVFYQQQKRIIMDCKWTEPPSQQIWKGIGACVLQLLLNVWQNKGVTRRLVETGGGKGFSLIFMSQLGLSHLGAGRMRVAITFLLCLVTKINNFNIFVVLFKCLIWYKPQKTYTLNQIFIPNADQSDKIRTIYNINQVSFSGSS